MKKEEELLRNTLTFLSGYLVNNGVGYYDELEIYKKIGFTKKDMEKYGLIDPELEKEISFFKGIKENKKEERMLKLWKY